MNMRSLVPPSKTGRSSYGIRISRVGNLGISLEGVFCASASGAKMSNQIRTIAMGATDGLQGSTMDPTELQVLPVRLRIFVASLR